MNIIDRAKAPTPKIFKVLRDAGLVLAAIGGVLMTAPVSLPAVIVSLGGYLTVAGGVLSAVSQITVDDNKIQEKQTSNEDEYGE